METVLLEAQKRDLKLSLKTLRGSAQIPAVIYGAGVPSEALILDYNTFRRVFIKAGENTLIDLKVSGRKDMKVLVHDVQYNPVTGQISHVDFINVRMDKEVDTAVPVEIIGSAPAVRDFAGIVSVIIHDLDIRCLPKDLVHSICVDVSGLAQLHDAIRVKELRLPPGIKIMHAPEEIVITVVPPRKEEVAAPVVVAPVEGAVGAEGTPVAGAEAVAPPEKEKKGKE